MEERHILCHNLLSHRLVVLDAQTLWMPNFYMWGWMPQSANILKKGLERWGSLNLIHSRNKILNGPHVRLPVMKCLHKTNTTVQVPFTITTHNADPVNNWHSVMSPNVWYCTKFFTVRVNTGDVLSVRGKRGQAGSEAGDLEQSLMWAMSAVQGENKTLPSV